MEGLNESIRGDEGTLEQGRGGDNGPIGRVSVLPVQFQAGKSGGLGDRLDPHLVCLLQAVDIFASRQWKLKLAAQGLKPNLPYRNGTDHDHFRFIDGVGRLSGERLPCQRPVEQGGDVQHDHLLLAPLVDRGHVGVLVENDSAPIGSEELLDGAFGLYGQNSEYRPVVVGDNHLLSRLLDLPEDLKHVRFQFALGDRQHMSHPFQTSNRQGGHGHAHDYGGAYAREIHEPMWNEGRIHYPRKAPMSAGPVCKVGAPTDSQAFFRCSPSIFILGIEIALQRKIAISTL